MITKACKLSNFIKNSGKECDKAMGPTAMLLAVPGSLKFTEADLNDPTWLVNAIHDIPSLRVYPFFGNKAPIREINQSPENDVIVTLDDGSQVFLRYGFYNTTFATTSGGLCYAKFLRSLNESGYSIIQFDKQGQLLVHDNGDGSYSGLATDFMYSPAPVLADLKTTPFKNKFMITYSPDEFVNNGVVLGGAVSWLSEMGLIDVEIVKAAAATTTKLKINVLTECAETNLLDIYPTELPVVGNFVVKDKADGSVVIPTAAGVVSGHIELTGTYVTGHTYTVSGSAASVWFSNGIEGYEATSSVDITIP